MRINNFLFFFVSIRPLFVYYFGKEIFIKNPKILAIGIYFLVYPFPKKETVYVDVSETAPIYLHTRAEYLKRQPSYVDEYNYSIILETKRFEFFLQQEYLKKCDYLERLGSADPFSLIDIPFKTVEVVCVPASEQFYLTDVSDQFSEGCFSWSSEFINDIIK